MPRPTSTHPLSGSERPQTKGSTLLGPVEANEPITVAVIVRQKPGSPEPPDLEYWENTPPDQRVYLSPEEFFERHGAMQEEVDRVAEYLKDRGLRIVEQHAGRRRIMAEGTAEQMNSAFGVTLNRYRAPERKVPAPPPPRKEGEGRPFGDHLTSGPHEYHGYEGPVHLPANLSGLVEAVIGLDNRKLGRPAGTGTGDPPGAAFLTPMQIAHDYHFPTNSAAAQTIGIFEDASAGAAYLHSDVNLFLGALPKPILTDIGLLGYSNNPLLVVNPALGGVFECNIDVSIAAASGQGANINVYFTDDSELGWDTFFDRAMFPAAGENPPSVLTASWVPKLSDDTGEIGDYTIAGKFANNLHGKLRSAAARGITVFMAIGDWGSENDWGDGKCHISYPNGDPFVTACGGTILGSANPVPPPALYEYTWSDGNNLASPFQGWSNGFYYEATGGGVSAQFPRPPYQVRAGVLPISKNDGGVRRGVPDVAGMVAMTGFVIDGVGPQAGYGTSAVAPLYAGLLATINAFLGRNAGFLNPTLYRYGPRICNDIRFGNNDSSYPPDAPFYTAAVGWDTCTGWGSINGLRLLAGIAPAPILVTMVEDNGQFGEVCVGKSHDRVLTINNSGFATLLIWSITSSNPEFVIPHVAAYPLEVAPGESIEVRIQIKPAVAGLAVADITIFSNDLFSPKTVAVSGTGVTPRLVLGIADSGNFGNVCRGFFHDELLVVNNAGPCSLSITDIKSSLPDFLPPQIVSYPMTVAAGASVELPIRFQPTALGAADGVITVFSNGGSEFVRVSANAPAGKLAVTGSNFFGAVKACCTEERTLSLCNVGDCKLNVTSVAFRRKNKHWRLINNPFPAVLHPGSCLAVVIRYKATERYPRACELMIRSDDPSEPVKVIELLAATIWSDCGCKICCDKCKSGNCDTRHCDPCCCQKCGSDGEDDNGDDA
jgi:Pro-kumamolisin, activation domain/Abnormal spindle-like microcephaly-assoc'd, ASPM-SPD-2-Hydin